MTVESASRLLRGLLAAGIALTLAASAHVAAGHHAPHPVVLLLVLALSGPVCVGLAGVRLSRWRLTAGILFTQGLLHALFALFPHHSSPPHAPPVAVGHHDAAPLTLPDPSGATQSSLTPDGSMIAAHLGAALLTFLLLRRGELLLARLARLLDLRPALRMALRGPVLLGPRRMTWTAAWSASTVSDLWPGQGPLTLRGPPSVA